LIFVELVSLGSVCHGNIVNEHGLVFKRKCFSKDPNSLGVFLEGFDKFRILLPG